jgi:ParB family chromosome partitioning protein
MIPEGFRSSATFHGDPSDLAKLLKLNTMSEMKHIALIEIKPDPNQPRKYYDETAMQELVASVKEKGVLQPILVRPAKTGKGYTLVCGERRYRAAMSVFSDNILKKDIPAVIRELNDDEALELQIIENLQRKDVHPLEEAVAFKSLLEKGKDVKEIAARVGKSDFYVRQRMRLNGLIKEWQKAFYAGSVTNADALRVSMLGPVEQSDLFKREVRDEALENPHYKIELSNWDFEKYKGDLSNAPFDIQDVSLNKKMGACTNCSFNTSAALLFPTSPGAAMCSNRSCFSAKAESGFVARLRECIDGGLVLFVNNSGSQFPKETEKLHKDFGIDVLPYSDFNDVDTPESLDYDQWLDDHKDDYDTEKELNKAWKEEEADHRKEVLAFQELISGGKYKKALVVVGDDKGKYIYIQLSKKTKGGSPQNASGPARNSAEAKEKDKAGTLTVADINAEIARLEEREKRNKELDLQKTHAELLHALKERKEFESKPFPLQPEDRGILVFLLMNSGRLMYKTIKGLPAFPDKRHSYSEEYFKKLCAVTDEQLALLIRMVAMHLYGIRNLQYGINSEDTVMRIIARYLDVDIDSIDRKQNEIAMARHEKLTKRIAELKAKKKALEKPKAKTANKSAKPKPANKNAKQ